MISCCLCYCSCCVFTVAKSCSFCCCCLAFNSSSLLAWWRCRSWFSLARSSCHRLMWVSGMAPVFSASLQMVDMASHVFCCSLDRSSNLIPISSAACPVYSSLLLIPSSISSIISLKSSSDISGGEGERVRRITSFSFGVENDTLLPLASVVLGSLTWSGSTSSSESSVYWVPDMTSSPPEDASSNLWLLVIGPFEDCPATVKDKNFRDML